jgi:hypothetical protein
VDDRGRRVHGQSVRVGWGVRRERLPKTIPKVQKTLVEA